MNWQAIDELLANVSLFHQTANNKQILLVLTTVQQTTALLLLLHYIRLMAFFQDNLGKLTPDR